MHACTHAHTHTHAPTLPLLSPSLSLTHTHAYSLGINTSKKKNCVRFMLFYTCVLIDFVDLTSESVYVCVYRKSFEM